MKSIFVFVCIVAVALTNPVAEEGPVEPALENAAPASAREGRQFIVYPYNPAYQYYGAPAMRFAAPQQAFFAPQAFPQQAFIAPQYFDVQASSQYQDASVQQATPLLDQNFTPDLNQLENRPELNPTPQNRFFFPTQSVTTIISGTTTSVVTSWCKSFFGNTKCF